MKLDLKKLSVAKKTAMASNNDERHLVTSAKELAALVKKVRKKNKKTQEEVAQFSNLSRLAVGEFESGKSDIKLSSLLKLLKACGLELEIRE
jgi:DNA-binding XRE family transcriptional regulator